MPDNTLIRNQNVINIDALFARQDDTLSALGISLSLALASALIVSVIGRWQPGWCCYRKLKAAR